MFIFRDILDANILIYLSNCIRYPFKLPIALSPTCSMIYVTGLVSLTQSFKRTIARGITGGLTRILARSKNLLKINFIRQPVPMNLSNTRLYCIHIKQTKHFKHYTIHQRRDPIMTSSNPDIHCYLLTSKVFGPWTFRPVLGKVETTSETGSKIILVSQLLRHDQAFKICTCNMYILVRLLHFNLYISKTGFRITQSILFVNRILRTVIKNYSRNSFTSGLHLSVWYIQPFWWCHNMQQLILKKKFQTYHNSVSIYSIQDNQFNVRCF